ncbi:MAG: TetR/AcrR family transcriptional regulator [Hyphomicrobium sp.]
MPKLKPETERARREHILDAAKACFARGGFHATTMQHICREAGVSPGAVYVYFDSKEALIAGLCARDRAELTARLEKLSEATDFLAALQTIGDHYMVHDPADNQRVVIEMGIESTRNPRVAEIFRTTDTFCVESFAAVFQRLKDEGRIAPTLDIATLTQIFIIIGDGLFWRRAIVPDFDARAVMPHLVNIIGALVNPVDLPASTASPKTEAARHTGKRAARA